MYMKETRLETLRGGMGQIHRSHFCLYMTIEIKFLCSTLKTECHNMPNLINYKELHMKICPKMLGFVPVFML